MTADVDYGAEAEFVHALVSESRAFADYKARGEAPILLDCGCGTGRLLLELTGKGYDGIGLDVSPGMLDAAMNRDGAENVLWICQDMTKMDLFGSVCAVVSMTDSVNHLLTAGRLASFFGRAHNFLDPGGLLIFDVLTESHFVDRGGKLKKLEYFADLDGITCFWTGKYSRARKTCVYDITCFSEDPEEKDVYRRFDDTVREKIWDTLELKRLLSDAGFVSVKVFKGGRGAPGGGTGRDRLFFVCEKGTGNA